MKKSIKIIACVLAVALFCAIPATASAKGPKFSFSLNIAAHPYFLPPPCPPAQIVEEYVYIRPMPRPLPPPHSYQKKTIIREYYRAFPPHDPYYYYPY